MRPSPSSTGSPLLFGMSQLAVGRSSSPADGRPYISKAANFVHKLAVRAKLVPQWDEPSTGGGSYAMLPGPGGARAEAERRR